MVSGPNLGRFGPRKVDSDADALPAAAQASDASEATNATNSDAQSWAASRASLPIFASGGMAALITEATVPTGSKRSSSSSNRVWPSSAVSGCVDWGGFFFGGAAGGGGGGASIFVFGWARRPASGAASLGSGRGVLGAAAAGRRRVGGPVARGPNSEATAPPPDLDGRLVAECAAADRSPESCLRGAHAWRGRRGRARPLRPLGLPRPRGHTRPRAAMKIRPPLGVLQGLEPSFNG